MRIFNISAVFCSFEFYINRYLKETRSFPFYLFHFLSTFLGIFVAMTTDKEKGFYFRSVSKF